MFGSDAVQALGGLAVVQPALKEIAGRPVNPLGWTSGRPSKEVYAVM